LRAAQPETSEIFSDGAKSFSGEHVSAWLLVCCARLLRAGAARALRSDPCGADPLVRRRVRLLVHLFSNRPDARAQLCSHRSAQGYTLAAGTDRARAGEFQFARRSPARTCAAVSLSLPRSTCLAMPAQEIGAHGTKLAAEHAGSSGILGSGIPANAETLTAGMMHAALA
jgi:hypothetical protein